MNTTLDRHRRRLPALALIAALGLGLAATARAQEPGKPDDEALESLIEKLGGQEPKDRPAADAGKDDQGKGDKPAGGLKKPNINKLDRHSKDKPSADAAKGDQGKGDKPAGDAEKPAAKPEAGKPAAGKTDVSSEDQAVDDLLEKLGATKDEPDAEDRPKQPGGGGEKPPGEPDHDGGGGGKDDGRNPGLTGEEKQIDEQLEELTGRKRKRNQGDRRQGEASGPMGKIVKEMRDIEERLGKPDTGDDTQGRQKEIVKQLETIIQQIRQSGSQPGKGMKEIRQAGGKPGDQPGDQPGANANGAPLSKPAKPTDKHAIAGGKDAWGHLPPELRQEIDNLFKEDSLPARQELIRRYYLSVSRKKLVRGE